MGIPLYTSTEKPSNPESSVPTSSDINPAQTTSSVAASTSSTAPTSGHSSSTSIPTTTTDGTVGSGIEGRATMGSEEAERLYEERMEEEYAKREGGA